MSKLKLRRIEMMRPNAAAAVVLGLSTATAGAGPTCTTADKSQWQDPTKFQEQLKTAGYEIRKFKVTDGNCYEIYGWDKARQKVEIYFDPVSGKAIKTEFG
jgi:hypothetical protein